MEVLLSSLAILLYTFAFAAAAAERQSRRKQKRDSPSPVLDVPTKKKKKMKHRSSQPAIGKLGDGPGSPEGSEEGQPETSGVPSVSKVGPMGAPACCSGQRRLPHGKAPGVVLAVCCAPDVSAWCLEARCPVL